MESNIPKDQQKIVELLQKAGQVEVTYPAKLLEKRRAAFLGLVAGVTAGSLAHEGIFRGLKHIKLPAKDAFIQLVLGTALITELAVSAYVFRDTIRDFFKKDTPTPAMIIPANIDTVTPAFVDSPEAPTETLVPTATYIITTAPQTTPEPDPVSTQLSTPVPTDNPTDVPDGTPGKHLGQTPKPPDQQATP